MRNLVCLIVCCSLAGCGLLAPDLLSQGIYGLEPPAGGRCRLAATAEEKDGRLLVEGRLSRNRCPYPHQAEIEVTLVAPNGCEIGKTRPRLRRSRNRRSGGTFAYFTAEFDRVPPPGTVIRVCAPPPETARRDGCGQRTQTANPQ